jgi:hypothetical protein
MRGQKQWRNWNLTPPLSRRVHTALTIPSGLRLLGMFDRSPQGLIKVDGTFA